MMRQLDLFAGIGGISLAAEWAGIETVQLTAEDIQLIATVGGTTWKRR